MWTETPAYPVLYFASDFANRLNCCYFFSYSGPSGTLGSEGKQNTA